MTPSGSAKLLVVDDVADNRDILIRRFERLGYEVKEADGGARALEMIAAETFDLVLLDIVMPEIDGMEVLRRVREHTGPETLPIIMVTAKAASDDVVTALAAGANDYVTKPVDLAVAKARVAVQIARKRAEDQSREARRELEETVALLQVAMEASQAANRAKSEFLANMSHEIRTPLNGVLGMGAMLACAELAPKEREMVEVINASGAHLSRLLSDVLRMAELEAGKVGLDLAPFALGELVQEVVTEARRKADDKGLALSLRLTPEADRSFVGDAARLRQALAALVANAVKFTEAGRVDVAAEISADGRLRIAVTDTGMGFDEADKAGMFAFFQQADGSMARRHGGAGLGLAIARQTVQLMGGVLDCASAPGNGATFWLEVPLQTTEPPAHARSSVG